MGLAATEYLGYKFVHTNRRRLRSGWLVKGYVYWTVGSEKLPVDGWATFLDEWAGLGYKIGLLLRDDQTIRRLAYGGAKLAPVKPQANQVANLDATHGTPANFKWHVWGAKKKRDEHDIIAANVVRFPVELTLSGGEAPQMIPVASRHWKGSFAQSVGGLWVIRPRRKARR